MIVQVKNAPVAVSAFRAQAVADSYSELNVNRILTLACAGMLDGADEETQKRLVSIYDAVYAASEKGDGVVAPEKMAAVLVKKGMYNVLNPQMKDEMTAYDVLRVRIGIIDTAMSNPAADNLTIEYIGIEAAPEAPAAPVPAAKAKSKKVPVKASAGKGEKPAGNHWFQPLPNVGPQMSMGGKEVVPVPADLFHAAVRAKVSNFMSEAHPDVYAKYKAMKKPGTPEARRDAFVFLFTKFGELFRF